MEMSQENSPYSFLKQKCHFVFFLQNQTTVGQQVLPESWHWWEDG
jgi:hypothetical protein